MNCAKKKAEHLAEFIAINWHHCPIDENVSVPDCECWKSEKCKSCLLCNVEHIKLRED